MAEQLVSNIAKPFDPKKYTDEYRSNLMRIIKAKMKGKKAKLEEPDEEPADPKVIDLMSRLRASLEQGRAKGGGGRARAARSEAGGERPAKGARARKRHTA